jgi:hypothetical protein
MAIIHGPMGLATPSGKTGPGLVYVATRTHLIARTTPRISPRATEARRAQQQLVAAIQKLWQQMTATQRAAWQPPTLRNFTQPQWAYLATQLHACAQGKTPTTSPDSTPLPTAPAAPTLNATLLRNAVTILAAAAAGDTTSTSILILRSSQGANLAYPQNLYTTLPIPPPQRASHFVDLLNTPGDYTYAAIACDAQSTNTRLTIATTLHFSP